MLANVVSKINSKKLGSIFVLDTGIVSALFKANHKDLELLDEEEEQRKIETTLSGLPQNIIIKFISESKYDPSKYYDFGLRTESLRNIGYVNHNLLISVEREISKPISLIRNWSKLRNVSEEVLKLEEFDKSSLEDIGLLLENYDYDEYQEKPSSIKVSKSGLQVDNSFKSVLKLTKLGTSPISLEDFSSIREFLPTNNTITLSIKRLDEKETQFLLRTKASQQKGGTDLVSYRKEYEAQKAIEQSELFGKTLFKIELTIVLDGYNEENLLNKAYQAKRDLKRIGDFTVEMYGAFPSFKSSLVGEKLHITQTELIDRVSPYFPFYKNGSNLENYSKRSFSFHRRDNSIDYLDPYNRLYSNYSGIIIGKSGKGKSVLTSNLLCCLNNDSKTQIMLVDVRGSHTNTVKKLGGEIHQISTGEACGISPFDFLREKKDKETIEIVLDFVEKLLLEDNELNLPRAEQAVLERSLLDYIESNTNNPSLDDFIRRTSTIPRKNTLERWKRDGLYGNIFHPYASKLDNRLHYFNFENIVTASKGGVSTVVMSAVMAHFNFKLLKKKNDESLIFIADETPFFVRNCYSSFNLLMKNVRKLDGSLILVAQNLSDLIVNSDTSLVNQTEFRIFFSKDEGNKNFKEASGLTDDGIQQLTALVTEKGKYSEFILKDSLGERRGRLVLSREEYLRSSTYSSDVNLVNKVKEVLSLKDENEALELLALYEASRVQ